MIVRKKYIKYTSSPRWRNREWREGIEKAMEDAGEGKSGRVFIYSRIKKGEHEKEKYERITEEWMDEMKEE